MDLLIPQRSRADYPWKAAQVKYFGTLNPGPDPIRPHDISHSDPQSPLAAGDVHPGAAGGGGDGRAERQAGP